MFSAPRYIHNSFSITFPRQSSVRRKANDLEDALARKLPEHYAQPQVISVPDDLDPEIPRLVFGSRHGFSQMVISQVSLSFNVLYSPEYQSDEAKRLAYLRLRIPVLYEILAVIDSTEPYFCGLNTRVHIASEATDGEVLAHVAKLLSRDETAEGLHDLQFKRTRVVERRYFSNTAVQNYRVWLMQDKEPGLPRLSASDARERGVQIDSDFNDRFAFNEDSSYVSSSAVATDLLVKGLAEVAGTVKLVGG